MLLKGSESLRVTLLTLRTLLWRVGEEAADATNPADRQRCEELRVMLERTISAVVAESMDVEVTGEEFLYESPCWVAVNPSLS